MGIVLCFLKPGVDAYRVATGHKQAPGAPLSPINELVIGKGGELVFEAIPALLMQSAILMAVGNPSLLAAASIIFSCLAVAYTSTTIAYDFETDPLKRKNNPEFYGCGLLATTLRPRAPALLVAVRIRHRRRGN
jgi:hypothetical protein